MSIYVLLTIIIYYFLVIFLSCFKECFVIDIMIVSTVVIYISISFVFTYVLISLFMYMHWCVSGRLHRNAQRLSNLVVLASACLSLEERQQRGGALWQEAM